MHHFLVAFSQKFIFLWSFPLTDKFSTLYNKRRIWLIFIFFLLWSGSCSLLFSLEIHVSSFRIVRKKTICQLVCRNLFQCRDASPRGFGIPWNCQGFNLVLPDWVCWQQILSFHCPFLWSADSFVILKITW